MPGFRLYTSNRLESLLDQLTGVLRNPLDIVLSPEDIVVQSLGMRRWLSLELAGRFGICANVRFPFPQTFVHDVFRVAYPEVFDDGYYARTALTWRIMKLLPSLLDGEGFQPLRHYLSGERPDLKRFQLAGKIAHTFDQYLAFRPELVLGWELGRDKHWQAVQWREIAAGAPKTHQAALAQRLVMDLKKGADFTLPQRVSIFGISTLPKFYLDFLSAIATRVDVHFFLLEPTPEWWRDILTERDQAKILRKQKKKGVTAEDLHLEEGNKLLASMGKLGRDFLGLVYELNPAHESEAFVLPEGETMLEAIQRDIFELTNSSASQVLSDDDASVQVHSCHSPMREVEVLYDRLLSMFSADPQLKPADILVMMPDVESYAPFIDAVFGTPEDEETRIPITIADRSMRAESGALDTFMRILELAGTRLGASTVLAVLESPLVQRKFGIVEADLEIIRGWVKGTAIRWGIDAAHRSKFGLPEFAQNTWREGIDRLLLGYAMPAGGERLFEGLLPFDDIEGSLAETLGSFVEFISELFRIVEDLARPRTLGDWRHTLLEALEKVFETTDETERELLLVRRVVDSLAETARVTGFDEPVEFGVLRAHLNEAFAAEEHGSGFLAGRVTFCALKPMRSIPAKVICLLGMNDTAFPRHATALGFDLIAQSPKAGDRTIRDDDRYLFLEAMLSARRMIYLSFVGQSLRDNSGLPPSVLVTELLDYLGSHFTTADGSPVAERVVTRHKLQPFSADYYNGGRLFSYSAENCRASDAAQQRRERPQPLISKPLPPPENELRAVTIASLIQFFRNPAKFFAQKRLGISLAAQEEALDDREPFEIGGLKRYEIEQCVASRALAGASPEGALPLVRAGGELPPCHVGDFQFAKMSRGAVAFAEVVKAQITGDPLPPRPLNLTVGEFTVSGTIEGLTSEALIHYRFAKLKVKDMLGLWIPLLALNCSEPACGKLLAKGERDSHILHLFKQVQSPEAILAGLLDLYWQGLHEPLRFFPETSYRFAELTLDDPGGKKDPREAASAVWDHDHGGCEKQDAFNDLLFRNVPAPLDATWEKIALDVFAPLIANREKVAL